MIFLTVPTERSSMASQGIGKGNMLKHRVSAEDSSSGKEDEVISDSYKNRFCIPLDFEILETHMPFYHVGVGDRLEYQLTFNDYNKIVR